MDEEVEEEYEERDDRDGDDKEAQPSAIILRNDLATYFAITELNRPLLDIWRENCVYADDRLIIKRRRQNTAYKAQSFITL